MGKSAIVILLVSTASLALIVPVSAQTMPSSGLSVSPAIRQISLASGQHSATFTTEITNNSSEQANIGVSVDDFTALNTTGSAIFLNNADRLTAPHGLAHWMSPELGTFTLEAHTTQKVPIHIRDAASMAPGGHYGAVIFRLLPVRTNAAVNRLASNTEVSVLVFVTTSNPGRQALSLTPPKLDSFTFSMPASVNLVFTNDGDVQTSPRGVVTLTDQAGHEISRGIVNVDSGLVLPGTRRLYQVLLDTPSEFAMPGQYTLTVYYRADGSIQLSRYARTFFYASPVALGLAVAMLGLPFCFVGWRIAQRVIRRKIKA